MYWKVNNTIDKDDRIFEFTTQLYFDDNITDQVYSTNAYRHLKSRTYYVESINKSTIVEIGTTLSTCHYEFNGAHSHSHI